LEYRGRGVLRMGRFAREMARQARERARQGSLFEEWVQMVQGLPPADQLTILHFLQGGPYRCERCADYLTAVCPGEGRAGWLAVRACMLRSEAAEGLFLEAGASTEGKGSLQGS
jgi:hypothetical protein